MFPTVRIFSGSYCSFLKSTLAWTNRLSESCRLLLSQRINPTVMDLHVSLGSERAVLGVIVKAAIPSKQVWELSLETEACLLASYLENLVWLS